MARVSTAMQKYLQATADYLRNLENTGASQATVTNYAARLELFRQFWEEKSQQDHKVVQDPGFTDIQKWRDHLVSMGRKPSTVRQYLKELSMFFAWASDDSMGEDRFYDRNPVSRRLVPDTRKLDKRPYDTLLTDEQVMVLWRNNPPADLHKKEFWPRNYALVVMLAATELRNGEMLSLRLCDLDFANEEITVEHGKGNKFRVVEFPDIAQTAVKLYLASGLRPEGLTEEDYLFGTQGEPGKPAAWKRGTSQWLSGVVERHVRAVTGVADIRSHDLRHVGARLDLNNGMSVEELQAKLGHESVHTTQIYSGKLVSRRARAKAAAVYEERRVQAARNANAIVAMGGQMA